MESIRVCGCDTGSRNIGLSIIDYDFTTKTISCIDSTHFVSTGITIPEQLDSLAQFFKQYLELYQPQVFAYEKTVFKGKAASGVGIGVQQATGVVRLIAYKKGCEEHNFTPQQVKMHTTGKATADKKDIFKVISVLFPNTKFWTSHDHATDACGVAISYLKKEHKIKL